jgi:Mg2+/citrate symporter
MFHFTSQEWISVLFENTQAGASAEIKVLSMIAGAGIVFGVLDDTSADCFIFRRL